MNSLLRVSNLNKYYKQNDSKFHVLKDINLHINSGDFIMILGKSGSGKTTLLNLLGLLDNFDEGRYCFNELDMNELDEVGKAKIRNEYMGFIFQQFNLIESLNIGKNVELPLLYNKDNTSNKKREELVDEYLDMVDLLNKKDKYPSELSGGQQQRISIARALINNPDVIFADEPTGSLDSKTSVEIMNVLIKLNKKNKTIVMVTHDEDLKKYANRVIYVEDGLLKKEI